jgi:hypothetical protein
MNGNNENKIDQKKKIFIEVILNFIVNFDIIN